MDPQSTAPGPESSPSALSPSSAQASVEHSEEAPTVTELAFFDIEVLDLFTLAKTVTIPFGDVKTRTEALTRNGYLVVTPS